MAVKIIRRDLISGAVAFATVTSFATHPAAASVTRHDIQIRRFKFKPNHIVVKVGDVIQWTNNDLAPHTITASELGWDSGEITKGDSFAMTVTAGMETEYFCAFHPHMKGSFDIQDT